MQNYIQKADVIDWTNTTGGAVTSGQPVFIGKLVGVAVGDIADTKTGEVRLTGSFKMDKTTGLVITAGDKLFWNTATKKVTKTATHKPLGRAGASALLNATSVTVILKDEVAAADLVAALTDNTGGVVSEIAAAIAAGGAYAQADMVAVKNALASIITKQTAIINALKGAGLMLGA